MRLRVILLTMLLKRVTHLGILTDFYNIKSKVGASAILERLEERRAAISATH